MKYKVCPLPRTLIAIFNTGSKAKIFLVVLSLYIA